MRYGHYNMEPFSTWLESQGYTGATVLNYTSRARALLAALDAGTPSETWSDVLLDERVEVYAAGLSPGGRMQARAALQRLRAFLGVGVDASRVTAPSGLPEPVAQALHALTYGRPLAHGTAAPMPIALLTETFWGDFVVTPQRVDFAAYGAFPRWHTEDVAPFDVLAAHAFGTGPRDDARVLVPAAPGGVERASLAQVHTAIEAVLHGRIPRMPASRRGLAQSPVVSGSYPAPPPPLPPGIGGGSPEGGT